MNQKITRKTVRELAEKSQFKDRNGNPSVDKITRALVEEPEKRHFLRAQRLIPFELVKIWEVWDIDY